MNAGRRACVCNRESGHGGAEEGARGSIKEIRSSKTTNPRLVSSRLVSVHMKSTVLNSNFVRGTVGI
jgi:hypothetical protein